MKNLKKPKAELFRLSKEVWNSITYAEIVETAVAMNDMEIFSPPLFHFDVECPKEAMFVFGTDSHKEIAEVVQTVTCHYDLYGANDNPNKFHMTFITPNGIRREMTPWSVERHGENALETYRSFYMFVYTALIVVLASKNVIKKQEVNDARAKNHQQREDSKSYTSTTTIKVGNITEYIGNKPEGSGRTVRAHLRRGHIRGVRHGEGRKEIKKVFIQPCFVNADRDWVATPRKSYNVVTDGKAVRV